MLLLMESYWLGARRFDEFCERTGILKSVVSDRLKRLIENDCLKKVEYSKRPQRFEYRATEQFYDFYPTALAMLHWERQWGSKKDQTIVRLRHNTCGSLTSPRPVCKSCRQEIDARDISWKPGPGVGVMRAAYQRRRRSILTERSEQTPLFDEIAQIIGDRWSTLILRSVFTGLGGFQEILDDTAISTNILSERLAELCEKGVLRRAGDDADGRRANYRLTDKGRAIYPILLSLLNWGDKWRPSPKGPPLLLTHRKCGRPLKLDLACSCCDESVKMRDTSYEFRIPTRSSFKQRVSDGTAA